MLTITPILPAMCRSNLRPKPNPLLEFPDNREGSGTIEPKGRRGAAGLWRREEEGAAAARGRQRAPPGAGPHTPAALRRHGRRPGGVPRPAGARRREHHADAGRLRARRSGAAPCRGDGQGEWRLASASSRSGSPPVVERGVEKLETRPVLSTCAALRDDGRDRQGCAPDDRRRRRLPLPSRIRRVPQERVHVGERVHLPRHPRLTRATGPAPFLLLLFFSQNSEAFLVEP